MGSCYLECRTSWRLYCIYTTRVGGYRGVGAFDTATIPSRWPRLLNSELHNFLTLLSTVFIVIHVLAVWIDPFTKFGWSEIFIPFASHYRTVWMALGIVGLYLGIAIGISTWLRPRIGYTWWRRLHVLTLVGYVLVTIHGIGTGSDTQTWWGLGIYAVSLVLVGALFCRRLYVSNNKRKHVPARPAPRNVGSVPPARPRTLAANRNAAAPARASSSSDYARMR